MALKSAMTARGQTVIPFEIRQLFHLSPTDRLEWDFDDSGSRVIFVKSDPVEAFRGRGAGGSVDRLLGYRVQDRDRE